MLAMDDRARELRSASTDAERMLWQRLRNRQLKNAKFRRQYPMKPYVLDFFCIEAQLVIEVDGSGHAGQAKRKTDQMRTAFLESCGCRVLRFWNNEVLSNIDGVLTRIADYL